MHCDQNTFQGHLDDGVVFDLVSLDGKEIEEVSAATGWTAERAFAEAAKFPGSEWISR